MRERHFFAWNNQHDRMLAAMAAERHTAAEIGAKIGVSRAAVIGRARRKGVSLSPKRPNNASVDVNNLIMRMIGQGRSAASIAAELGVCVETVYHRARKMGSGFSNQNRRIKMQVPEVRLPPLPQRSVAETMSLLDAQNNDCRWPYDCRAVDGVPRCCGHKILQGTSFCLEHAMRVYITLPKSCVDPQEVRAA